MEDATIKIAVNNLSHLGAEKSILPGKALIIDLFKSGRQVITGTAACDRGLVTATRRKKRIVLGLVPQRLWPQRIHPDPGHRIVVE